MDALIAGYGEANEKNEMTFEADVNGIIFEVEIYDQIWYAREISLQGKHSVKAIELVKEIIARLENIPDGCAECFPFETIDELENEYLQG
ncbi:hypothetical protein MASR2M70_03310 [Bacillota bacterium]